MAGHVSQDLKERIVWSVLEEGLSQAETARRLMVSAATVSRTMKAYRERGTVERVKFKPGPAPKLKEKHLEWLRARVKESPFLSTYELTPLGCRSPAEHLPLAYGPGAAVAGGKAKKKKHSGLAAFEPPRNEREARVMEAARRACRLAQQKLRTARDPAASKEACEAVWEASDEVGRTTVESAEKATAMRQQEPQLFEAKLSRRPVPAQASALPRRAGAPGRGTGALVPQAQAQAGHGVSAVALAARADGPRRGPVAAVGAPADRAARRVHLQATCLDERPPGTASEGGAGQRAGRSSMQACKTLVTQRLKASGAPWSRQGAGGVRSLRSLLQSDRFSDAFHFRQATRYAT